jgi:hypothetical protein
MADKVKIIDVRTRVQVKATAKHRKPGTIRNVAPMVAEKGIKNGFYEDPKKVKSTKE